MGVEYRLLKMHRPESYDLGKGRTPMRPEASSIRTIIDLVTGGGDPSDVTKGPGPNSVWAIAQDGGDCVPMRLDLRWPDGRLLADLILSVLQAAKDAETATAIAVDLLRWSGSDEVILVADNLDGAAIARREGTTVSNWMETGSAYEPGGNAGSDGGEP